MQFIKAFSPYLRPAGRLALGCAAVAVTFAVLASTFGPPDARGPRAPAQEAARPAPGGDAPTASVWTELPGAGRRFLMGPNSFGPEPDFYAARRHSAGGGRLDQFAIGSAARPAPFLLVSIYRPLDEPVRAVSFWLEMARRAGEAGLALERAAPVPQLAPTRLGLFEIGAVTAAGRHGPRDCLGFRLQPRGAHAAGRAPVASPAGDAQSSGPVLFVSGLACPGEQPVGTAEARDALVCALESIALSASESDSDLAAFFEGVAPPACPSRRSVQLNG